MPGLFIRPGRWIIDICDKSIVLPSVRIYVMLFEIMTGDIVLVACFDRCIFAPESAAVSVFLLE